MLNTNTESSKQMSGLHRSGLWLWLFILALPAAAATYYIDPSGNDLNDGPIALSPWKTLRQINSSRLVPGDVVLLRRGAVWHETLKPPNSGSALQHITFSSYGVGTNPIIDSADLVGPWSPLTIIPGPLPEDRGVYQVSTYPFIETSGTRHDQVTSSKNDLAAVNGVMRVTARRRFE